MIDNKARLFVPLPMNPLHRHLKDSTQSTISVTKEITLLPQISSSDLLHIPSSGRAKNPSQHNSTSDFTIIEIIKPDKDSEKHDSKDFIPAFAKPPMIQDSSLESATLMNLKALKTSFLQGETQSFPCYTASDMGSSSVLASSPPFQSVPSHQIPPQSTILASGQQQSSHQLTYQQSPYQSNYHQGSTKQQSTSDDSSFISETDNTPNTPDFSLLPLPISTLTKLKVVFWVNELRRYLFLWETSRMNSAHAAELHQLLCKIEDKMADPFLTPKILGETSLGRVMKSFTHGTFDARLKEVARHVVGYWRKVCLEA